MIITDSVPGVVIGHAVADCPVVMMVDEKRGVAAIGHCSAEMIDKKLNEGKIVRVLNRDNSDIVGEFFVKDNLILVIES